MGCKQSSNKKEKEKGKGLKMRGTAEKNSSKLEAKIVLVGNSNVGFN